MSNILENRNSNKNNKDNKDNKDNKEKNMIIKLIPQDLYTQIIETRTGIPTESEKTLLKNCCYITEDVLYRTAKMQQILKTLYTVLELKEFSYFTQEDVLNAIKRVKKAIQEHRNNPCRFVDDLEVACDEFVNEFKIDINRKNINENKEIMEDIYIYGYLSALWYKKKYINDRKEKKDKRIKKHYDREIFLNMKRLIVQNYTEMDISLLETKLNKDEKVLFNYFKDKNNFKIKKMDFYPLLNKS